MRRFQVQASSSAARGSPERCPGVREARLGLTDVVRAVEPHPRLRRELEPHAGVGARVLEPGMDLGNRRPSIEDLPRRRAKGREPCELRSGAPRHGSFRGQRGKFPVLARARLGREVQVRGEDPRLLLGPEADPPRIAEPLSLVRCAQRDAPAIPLAPSGRLGKSAGRHRVLDRALVQRSLELEPVRPDPSQLGSEGVPGSFRRQERRPSVRFVSRVRGVEPSPECRRLQPDSGKLRVPAPSLVDEGRSRDTGAGRVSGRGRECRPSRNEAGQRLSGTAERGPVQRKSKAVEIQRLDLLRTRVAQRERHPGSAPSVRDRSDLGLVGGALGGLERDAKTDRPSPVGERERSLRRARDRQHVENDRAMETDHVLERRRSELPLGGDVDGWRGLGRLRQRLDGEPAQIDAGGRRREGPARRVGDRGRRTRRVRIPGRGLDATGQGARAAQ